MAEEGETYTRSGPNSDKERGREWSVSGLANMLKGIDAAVRERIGNEEVQLYEDEVFSAKPEVLGLPKTEVGPGRVDLNNYPEELPDHPSKRPSHDLNEANAFTWKIVLVLGSRSSLGEAVSQGRPFGLVVYPKLERPEAWFVEYDPKKQRVTARKVKLTGEEDKENIRWLVGKKVKELLITYGRRNPRKAESLAEEILQEHLK